MYLYRYRSFSKNFSDTPLHAAAASNRDSFKFLIETLHKTDLFTERNDGGDTVTYHQCADFDASVKWLQDYCLKKQVKELFYNRQYEVNEHRHDQQLERCLGDKVICKSFDDSCHVATRQCVKQ